MKFFSAIVIALIVYQCSIISAVSVGSRSKRFVTLEECPKNLTDKQCQDYAQEELAKSKHCRSMGVGGGFIQWKYCGTVLCEFEGKEGKLTDGDLSKPYPECCPTCDF